MNYWSEDLAALCYKINIDPSVEIIIKFHLEVFFLNIVDGIDLFTILMNYWSET